MASCQRPGRLSPLKIRSDISKAELAAEARPEERFSIKYNGPAQTRKIYIKCSLPYPSTFGHSVTKWIVPPYQE